MIRWCTCAVLILAIVIGVQLAVRHHAPAQAEAEPSTPPVTEPLPRLWRERVQGIGWILTDTWNGAQYLVTDEGHVQALGTKGRVPGTPP